MERVVGPVTQNGDWNAIAVTGYAALVGLGCLLGLGLLPIAAVVEWSQKPQLLPQLFSGAFCD